MTKAKILIVEDSSYWQLVLAKVLERHDFDCTIESNTIGALSRLGWEDFDLVVLDWELKHWNTKYIEEFINKRQIPALYFTGHERHEIQNQTNLPIIEKTSEGFSCLVDKINELLEYREKYAHYK